MYRPYILLVTVWLASVGDTLLFSNNELEDVEECTVLQSLSARKTTTIIRARSARNQYYYYTTITDFQYHKNTRLREQQGTTKREELSEF